MVLKSDSRGGKAVGVKCVCVCVQTLVYFCMIGSAGASNQRSGTKPATGVPQRWWCVCSLCFMACVWHADVCGLGAGGERAGGRRKRQNYRWGGRGGPVRRTGWRRERVHVVIEMLKASRRQSVCFLFTPTHTRYPALSLLCSSLWARRADESCPSLEDNNGHHSVAAVSIAYLPPLVFVAWQMSPVQSELGLVSPKPPVADTQCDRDVPSNAVLHGKATLCWACVQ